MKRIREIEFNKLFFLISILLIIAACVPSKKNNGNSYFEGEITYKSEYIPKSNLADTAELIQKLGTGATFCFKEGNHFGTFANASELVYELYNRRANKLYIKENQSDTLHWVDCSNDAGGKMLKFELHPKAEKILGIECDELVTYYENKTVFDYFNPETLRVNPDWYSKHTLYNKDWTYQKMGALFLKHKVEFRAFVMSITATTIKEHHLNDSLFIAPKNKVMVKETW